MPWLAIPLRVWQCSIKAPSSASANGVNDLDLIAAFETISAMGTARYDLTIHFQSDAFASELQPLNQILGGECFGYVGWTAIDENLHVRVRW